MKGLSNYEKEIRPWGNFERFALNERSTVKIITINPNEALSLQSHVHRDEFWRVISGSGVVTVGAEKSEIKAGGGLYVPTGSPHRAEAGPDGLQFLELSFGDFDEGDITRLEDRYGRT